MSDCDYKVKVMLIGDDLEGKAYLASNFFENYFASDYKHTIGIDFHIKSLRVLGKTMTMQIWELLNEERFQSLESLYYRGANGAIIISDITKPNFRDHLDDTIQTIREIIGDIPIILIASKLHSEENQAVSREKAILAADDYNISVFTEILSASNQNSELIFKKLGEQIIRRLGSSPPPKPLGRPLSTKPEFIINNYLKLRLEYGNTNIYVGGELFKQCKYLLLNIPETNIRDYDEINSIDEASEKLDSSMERGKPRKYNISPDVEFWGHCSNLQAWHENDYNSCILHRNLAFPLLRALVKVGDPLAKKVFKEEIAQRIAGGYPSVVEHLINQGYLEYLNEEELNTLLDDRNFIKNLPKWFNDFKDIPKWLSRRIKAKLDNLKCPSCGSKISHTLIKTFLHKDSIRCEFCDRYVTSEL